MMIPSRIHRSYGGVRGNLTGQITMIVSLESGNQRSTTPFDLYIVG